MNAKEILRGKDSYGKKASRIEAYAQRCETRTERLDLMNAAAKLRNLHKFNTPRRRK